MNERIGLIGIATFLLYVGTVLGSGSGPSPEMVARANMMQAASEIVGQPENWKGNSQQIVRFIEQASVLGLSDDADVQEFERNARKLVSAGTRWSTYAKEEQIGAYKSALSAIEAEWKKQIIEASRDPKVNVSGGIHFKNTEELKQSYSRVEKLFADILDDSARQEVMDAWQNSLDAYKRLLGRWKRGPYGYY